jgi:hypothetical protein
LTDYDSVLRSAIQQKYAMIEKDPRDEKWAEFHIHPDTVFELGRTVPAKAYAIHPITANPLAMVDGGPLFGYPVRVDPSIPVGEIQLVCETDLDASIRHQQALGRTITVYKPEPLIIPPPPAPPTVKALAKHWLANARRKLGSRR